MITTPGVSAQLGRKLAELADRCVRHITVTFPRISRCPHCFKDLEPPRNHFYGDDKITALRVMVGIATQRAAMYAIEDQVAERTALPTGYAIPRATSVEDPGHLEEATTKRYRKGQDPERPRTMLPPPLPPLPTLSDDRAGERSAPRRPGPLDLGDE